MLSENKTYTCSHGKKMDWHEARKILKVTFSSAFLYAVERSRGICLYDFVKVEDDLAKVDKDKCQTFLRMYQESVTHARNWS